MEAVVKMEAGELHNVVDRGGGQLTLMILIPGHNDWTMVLQSLQLYHLPRLPYLCLPWYAHILL